MVGGVVGASLAGAAATGTTRGGWGRAETLPVASAPPAASPEPEPDPAPSDDLWSAESSVADLPLSEVLARPTGALLLDRKVAAPAKAAPPRPPPRPAATPGMTTLPAGISAARADVALPVDPERLLHVEQQLLPAHTPASFRILLRPDRR